MRDNMTQNEINQSEWNQPGNWSALTYASRRDRRIMVPRRRGIGWTLNFGNSKARWLFGGLLALPLVILAVVWRMG